MNFNHLRRDTFWKIDLGEGAKTVDAIVNKWGLMLYLMKPESEDIQFIYKSARKIVSKIFEPEDLEKLNVENYEIQSDWIKMRSVVINMYRKRQLLEHNLLITNQEIQERVYKICANHL